ncbi:cytidine deaminase [Shimia sp. MIT1388]|uniref:cytidine deaminase n=1 Tax=Shimia sp. MIT1388 TaxID=3096992 RepID=UPI00399AF4B2
MSLEKTAFAVRENAYAPYSQFKVGAAVLSEGGTIYAGCNVENIAYPEGTCAEAGAIAAMVAAGETKLNEVFVVADSKQPVSPCGGCRQKLAEFGGADTKVTLANLDGARVEMTMAELLPGAFGKDHLGDGHADRD